MSPRRSPPAFRAAALAATLLITGCAVGPDFERPKAPATGTYTEKPLADLPAAGGETRQRLVSDAEVAREWWRSFESPDLNAIIALAIADSPTLEVSRATLAKARQQIVATQGGLFPQLDFSADVSRAKARGTGGRTGTIGNTYSFGPFVSFDPDVFGGIRRSVEQVEALAELQRYELGAAYLTLTGNVVAQALTIASIRAQLGAVDELIGIDRRNLDLTRASYRGGRSARTDVLSAEAQLASDLTQLPPLNQQLSVARHALAVLIGRPPGDWMPPDFDLERFAAPETLPVSVPSELVRKRPDILAAEATLHASSAAVGVATANLYPNLSLSAAWSRVAADPNALFSPASVVWNIAAGLAQPLFHGGSLTAQRQAAVEQLNADLASYRDTVLVSFGQVADVLRALEHDAQLLDAQRTAMDTAQSSLDLVQESYRVGQASLLQVLDAERLLFQARLGFVRAKAQRLQDTAQLYVAMGGGWTAYAPAAPQDVDLFSGIRGP